MSNDEINRKIFDNWKSAVLINELPKQSEDNKILLEITDNNLYAGCYSEKYPYPLFNCILELKPTSLSTNLSEIDEIISKYTSKGIPFTWWINPFNTLLNDRLEDYLSKKGFIEEYSQPHMALTATEDMITDIKNTEKRLEIKSVKTLDELLQYLDLIAKIFSFPETIAETMKEVYTKYFFNLEIYKKGKIELFMGFKDDNPVGTGSIFFDSGVAGLFSIGIMPEYQKQGLGKYITNFLIKEAFEKGFQTSVLQASPMGYPLYEKLGFKTYYNAKQYNLK